VEASSTPTIRVQRMLQPLQVKVGITKLDEEGNVVAKYPGPHCLRHFYASWLINRKEDGGLGLPPKMVQELLGHVTLAMTTDNLRPSIPE
jgi:integrase